MSLQAQDLFNLGRFQIFRGLTVSSDRKTIYFDSYTKAPYAGYGTVTYEVYEVIWKNGAWSDPTLIPTLPGETNHTPVISSDGRRLYFTSSAPAPGKSAPADQNIWYIEKNNDKWGTPVFVNELNTDANERAVSVSAEGDLYFTSDDKKGLGATDFYVAHFNNDGFEKPENIQAFNSPTEEVALSMDTQERFAILMRRENPYTVNLYISFRSNGQWTPLQLLKLDKNYDQATASYFAPRFIHVSGDGSTLMMNINFLPYSIPISELLKKSSVSANDIKLKRVKELAVPKAKYGEIIPFAPNQLQTNNGFRLSADNKTAWVAQYTPKFYDDKLPGTQTMKILESKWDGKKWGKLKVVEFGDPNVTIEYYPSLSADGKRMFFNSKCNGPGSVPFNNTNNKNNLFYVEAEKDGWGPRVFVNELATENSDEDYCTQASDGTLYFRSSRPDGRPDGDIYKSELLPDGHFGNPEKIQVLSAANVNEGNLFVDPKERYIIFSRSLVETQQRHEVDLYISFRKNEGWTNPRPLTKINTVRDWEMTPSVSADGKYFYFERTQNIMRVEFESLLLPDEIAMLKL